MLRRFFVMAVIFGGLVVACRANARAMLVVCDRSPQPVSVALAVESASTNPAGPPPTRSQGWWQIDASACIRLIDTDLDPTQRYFVYAKSAQITWAGVQSKKSTDAQFCVNRNDAFNYVDRTAALCDQADDQMLWFVDEKVSGPNWTVNLDVPT
jgi:uncharacterized membrane protein